MALIVVDDELARVPFCFVNIFHHPNPARLQEFGKRRDILRFEIKMDMPALVNVGNRGVLLIYKFEMDEMFARPKSNVEILIVELNGEAKLFGVEMNRRRDVRRT